MTNNTAVYITLGICLAGALIASSWALSASFIAIGAASLFSLEDDDFEL